MAVKTLAQLTADILATIKDNGGPDASQTQGALHRLLEQNIIESSFLKKEETVEQLSSATFDLSFDKIIGGPKVANLITASTLTISATQSPKLGKVAVLVHKASAEPTYVLPSGWQLVRQAGGGVYVNNAINELSFQYLGYNLVKLIISQLTIVP
jgi:hypothetical protein